MGLQVLQPMNPPTEEIMFMSRKLTSIAVVVAGLALTACSSDDNLDQFEYQNFPGIDTSELAGPIHEPAVLSGDSLKYQVALVADALLDLRPYDEVVRPLGDAERGGKCELGGRQVLQVFAASIDSPHFPDSAVTVSQDTEYGCMTPDTAGGDTVRNVVGQIAFAQADADCAGDDCTAEYNSYGTQAYPHRVQYLTPAGAGASDWRRVEIHGYSDDGPRQVTIDDASRQVYEQAQQLTLVNSIATLSGEGEQQQISDEKNFALIYGDASHAFVRSALLDDGSLMLEGPLASASNLGGVCGSGAFSVHTTEPAVVSGGSVTGGTLELVSGNDDDADADADDDAVDDDAVTVTVAFDASGNATVTDGDGASSSVSHAEIENLRAGCLQQVAVKRTVVSAAAP